MSKAASFSTMQQAIVRYVKDNIPQPVNNAHHGRISGNRVVVGNKSYPYAPAVDMYFGDGSGVYCILPDSGNMAAVVGVG